MAIRHGTGQPQATTPGAPPTYLIDDSTGVSPLPVRNATTGALVARVTVPPGYPGGNSRTYITGVATGNGRDYLVAEYANPCRSWIYRFSLDSAGRPSALTGQIHAADLVTGRTRVVYASAAQPGLITPDPGVRYLLLQIGEQASQPGRLNLATGKTTNLPAPRFVLPAVRYW